jgi:hopene-associated glycosyltransferase HpnB
VCDAVGVLVAVAASLLAAVAWLYLLLAHGGYWRTDQRLPGAKPAAMRWPGVVAVVPARDEAALLPLTLPALLAQDYPGSFEVVLVDDGSSDGTAAVAAAIGRDAARPVQVIAGSPPPAGWAGKVWAMTEGLRAAPDSEYVLFTDADIRHEPGVLAGLVGAAERDRRVLVSQLAMLQTESRWERALVPAFGYFFAQLYPFRRVNRPGARTAAAAGGCMLVRRSALSQAGGLERISAARIDDVALGRLLKRSAADARCWLGLSTDIVSLRPYPRLGDLWDMIARSAYTQLRYSPALLAATIAGLLWIYALPPLAAVGGLAGLAAGGGAASAWLAASGLAAWLLMSVSYLPVLRLYRLSPLRAVWLPAIALGYAAMTADSARRHYAGRGGEWKGRILPARASESRR